jgi:hypothetical protein
MGCFVHGQATKESQLDHLAHARIDRRQRADRIVEGDDVALLRVCRLRLVIDSHVNRTAPTFLASPVAGRLDQDPSHHLRRNRQEVRAIPPFDSIDVDQPQVRLVHQLRQRRYDDVIVWANNALDRDPQQPFARELLGGAYWKLGDLKRAGEMLRDRTGEPDVGNDEFRLVMRYAEAGDLDAAFEHLHRLIDARDPALFDLAVAPHWDSLRADPRFNQCLVRMKLR